MIGHGWIEDVLYEVQRFAVKNELHGVSLGVWDVLASLEIDLAAKHKIETAPSLRLVSNLKLEKRSGRLTEQQRTFPVDAALLHKS